MPIVNVTGEDAQAYCGWSGGRLLTEAEREYAARGGSTAARYSNLDETAWHQKKSGGQTHDLALLATLLLVAVAVLAGYLPARRAAGVEPTVALRYE